MENNNLSSETPKKSKKWLWIVIVLILAVVGLVYYFLIFSKQDNNKNSDTSKTTNGQPVTIPEKVLNNKFGFLGGGAEDDGSTISESGAAWVRPHPGAFLWDAMQKGGSEEINFENTDTEISNYQKNNLGILATLWPFADWDQKNLANAADCRVSSNDEFLPKNDKKGRGAYLPQYRCNPSDWTAYGEWVKAVVERYDGDGNGDIQGLKMPVKYWEVMNEPDLQYQSNLPAGETDRLTFYKQGPAEYAKLLIETSKAIRSADPEAKILIAGAAGADSRMLSFYQEVFKNVEVSSAFDIGNVHCISNDRETSDFNVVAYKNILEKSGITKPIWVTEAEAMYGTTGEANYLSTKKSTEGAIAAGAVRIFFTRYTFDDFRSDMSKKTGPSTYPSAEKYKEMIEGLNN
ncbi:MAG: glycosyl hydrolase [Patescibacteria group bacterium]|nr:glycosyl hydrolase [Patescibacteria group bacterium]